MSVAAVASVVIPTCNGGDRLLEVINAVLKQEAPWPYELIVIDSESDDGSVERVRTRIADDGRARLIEIKKSEFGHGRTRNRGVEAAEGEFVAFLTQDALPCSDTWLSTLVMAVSASDRIAGAFGRHIAFPEHSCITRKALERHFDRYRDTPLLRIKDGDRYTTDARYRQFLRFYSDNNACLRRDVWRSIPYPDVDFGEDQAWAKLVLEAGHAIAYADAARVYHSHQYGLRDTFRRSSEEAFHFEKYFGHGVCETLPMAVAMAAYWSIRDAGAITNIRGLCDLGATMVSPFRNVCRAAGYWHGSRRFRRGGSVRSTVGNK